MDNYQKYLKYKQKYIFLKQSINNNNLEGGHRFGYYSTLMFFGRITLKDIDVKERSVNVCLTAVKKKPFRFRICT